MELSPPEPPLADGLVMLRAFDERDLPLLERASDDPEVVRAFGRSGSASEALAFHRRRWQDGTAAAFAICPQTEESVGAVLLEPCEVGRADLGYWLLAESRGRGYATRGARLVAEWALRDLGIARVQLWATPENEASQRVAEQAGFTREGILRDYGDADDGGRVDAVFYSLIASDLEKTPEVVP